MPEATIADLPLKLRNEKRINRKLRTIFNQIGDVAEIELGGFKSIPDISIFTNDLIEIIKKDSNITSKSFRSSIRKRLKLGNVESRRINAEIDTFIELSSRKQAELIIKTTQKRMDKIIDKVIIESVGEDVSLSATQLAKKVTSKFKKENRNRSAIISQTEVQRVSEQSKFIEASMLKRTGHIALKEKRWDSILDQVTRTDHAIADSQIKPFDEPFDVGGELLMQPGDTRFGASAKNVVNCRCSSQFLAEKI